MTTILLTKEVLEEMLDMHSQGVSIESLTYTTEGIEMCVQQLEEKKRAARRPRLVYSNE